jgi:hypothetical protein
MKSSKNWLWLLALGSLWGMSEVWGGEFLYANGIPHSSLWLSAFAIFLIAVARGLVNVPGSTAALGAVASVFKLVNASPFYCHLLAIFLLGVAFDVAASALCRKEDHKFVRGALTGILGTFGGYASFALLITYIIRYEPWVHGGAARVIHHIFVAGSLAALAGTALFPAGLKIGSEAGKATVRKPVWSAAGAVATAALIWTIGRLVK